MNAETNSLNRRIARLDSLFLWVSSLSGIGFSIFIAYLKMPLEPYIPIFALIAYSLAIGYVSGAIFFDSFTERIRGWGYLTLGLALYATLTVIKINESSIYDLLNSPKAVPYLQIVIGFALPLGCALLYNKFAVPRIYGILKQPKEGVTDIILWRSILASFYLGSLLYISALALFETITSLESLILYVCFFVIFLVPLISEEIGIRDFLRLEKYQSYLEVEKRISRRRWKTSMILLVVGIIAYMAQSELFPYLPLYVWSILFFLAIMLPTIGLVLVLQFVPVRYTFTLKTKATEELSGDQHKELKDLVGKMNSPNPPKKGEGEKKRGNLMKKHFFLVFLCIGLIITAGLGGGLFLLYQWAPSYSIDPKYRGFAIARSYKQSFMPHFLTVQVFVPPAPENPTFYFRYYFSVAENGSYNFIFIFPFKITQMISPPEGMHFNATHWGTAIWIKRQIADVGIGWKDEYISGKFQIDRTFVSGRRGEYVFSLPFFGGVGGSSDLIHELQQELEVTWHTPDARVELEFVVPSRLMITQAYPQAFSGPDTLEISGNRTINRVLWDLSWPDQQFTIICQDTGETAHYESLLFLSGVFLSVGAGVIVRSAYDGLKGKYLVDGKKG